MTINKNFNNLDSLTTAQLRARLESLVKETFPEKTYKCRISLSVSHENCDAIREAAAKCDMKVGEFILMVLQGHIEPPLRDKRSKKGKADRAV